MGFKALVIWPSDGTPHSPIGTAWDKRGVMVAQCDYRIQHGVAPDESCSCGIYGAFNLDLEHELLFGNRRVLFLMEGFGKCIVCENGFRSEVARLFSMVETPWHKVDYNQIAVYPPLPRISFESASAVIYKHRAQWLSQSQQ